MEFELTFDNEAIDFLNTLPKEMRQRIFRKLQSTKSDPFRFFERLEGRDEYKLRIGDYRAIADIDQRKHTISVLLIGHRKNVYKQ